MGVNHTSTIELKVELDENRIPEQIEWSAQDGGINKELAKAMVLSVWDPENKETLAIDLWTKDMPVEEMKVFMHQTLVSLTRTFHKATSDDKMTATMQDFCDYFAKHLNLGK